MGTYVIPNATRVDEVIAWRGLARPGESWSPAEGGILYTAPDVNDAEAAARYEGFTPAAVWPPDDQLISGHVDHILAVARATDTELATRWPTVPTDFLHAFRDLARAFIAYVRRDWEKR